VVMGATIVLRNVFFDIDDYTLKSTSFAELNTLVEILNDNPSLRIEIAGHTDNTGLSAHNDTLSEQRANSVRDYLLSQGISHSRITAKGFGSRQPVCKEDSPECRQQNRRTEFRIIGK